MHFLLLIAGISSAIANPVGEYLYGGVPNLSPGIPSFGSAASLPQSESNLIPNEISPNYDSQDETLLAAVDNLKYPSGIVESSQYSAFTPANGVDAVSFNCSPITAICCQATASDPKSDIFDCRLCKSSLVASGFHCYKLTVAREKKNWLQKSSHLDRGRMLQVFPGLSGKFLPSLQILS